MQNLSDDELNRLELAEKLADVAAEVTLDFFRSHGEAINKLGPGDFDPVTKADKDAETVMRALIEDAFPEDGINGEEFGIKDGRSDWVWYLDPIDGTRAFIAGLPSWTTLIGCVKTDQPLLGVIDQPYLNERYVGWTHGASFKSRGETLPLNASEDVTLETAILSTTDPFIFSESEQSAFLQLSSAARLTRFGLDAYAYARLAAGDIHLVAETGLQPHDIAALIPVVRGAGGVALDWTGNQAVLGPDLLCGSSPGLAEEAIGVLIG